MRSKLASLKSFLPTFLFLILLMTAFMRFSHGTQDVYPTFLEVQIGLTPQVVGTIGVIYGFAQIAGGFVFGTLSEKWGRKRAIVTAALLSIARRFRCGRTGTRRSRWALAQC